MVRERSSNKSGFVDYDPVRARTEGRAPADIRDELVPKLLSGEVLTKVTEERL